MGGLSHHLRTCLEATWEGGLHLGTTASRNIVDNCIDCIGNYIDVVEILAIWEQRDSCFSEQNFHVQLQRLRHHFCFDSAICQ